ncbi:pancreatic lipase-related protein 3-like [Homarus americanus]|uniref:pancreatic lipase-related protein 3-like n=1 Tax=Homarus americanus TaxID=6706 RepID=UPI001C437A52|nr:pancreatic lipase-related protein 3-like [Homarus americanus]
MLKLVLLVVVVQAVLSRARTAPKVNLDDVHFLLWTRSNPGNTSYYELFLDNKENLDASPFNPSDPTFVMIHGFAAHGDRDWPVDAKTELLALGSYNILSVNWARLANAPWYPAAVNHVPQVGIYTAQLLDWLKFEGGMDGSKVQITGHSLGAHVAGAVGQNLVAFTLPMITGLDPAGPEFYEKTASERLDPSDAKFVQIIHTNGGTILQSCVGLKDSVGHVDFYPNGGKHQPGCVDYGAWTDLLEGGCSHRRSHDLWVESISGSLSFTSYPCEDWESFQAGNCDSCGQGCLEMGFHVDHSLRGTYYLTTNSDSPYARG